MKISNFTGVVGSSIGQVVLREGQTIDDSHPLVSESPHLFRDLADGEQGQAQTPNPRVVESTMQSGPGGGRVRKVAGQ
jgi:hypothetical protein